MQPAYRNTLLAVVGFGLLVGAYGLGGCRSSPASSVTILWPPDPLKVTGVPTPAPPVPVPPVPVPPTPAATEITLVWPAGPLQIEVVGSPVPPDPPVPPVPVTGLLWITVVEDSNLNHRTPQQAAVYASKALRDAVATGHLRWRLINANMLDTTGTLPAELAPYFTRAKGKTLPWMMFEDAAGNLLYDGTLPATAGEVVALVQKYRSLGPWAIQPPALPAPRPRPAPLAPRPRPAVSLQPCPSGCPVYMMGG